MQGKKSVFYSYLQLLLLGFVFFSFSCKFSLQEGKLALAYNTHNLGRDLICEKFVQNPEEHHHVEGSSEQNFMRVF